MKNIILPVAAAVVLGLATVSIVRTQPHHPANDPPIAPPQTTFSERVAAVGLIEANSENISLASHLPGGVEKVFVVVGQEVAAGDPLVKLDTRALGAAGAERSSDTKPRGGGGAAPAAPPPKRRAG